jgi:glycerol-3-phosphate cytidylyltransferase
MINGKRVIYTAGTFDLFNIGHLNILRKSKAMGDILIVGVSTDELVESYKYMSPIISYSDRYKIIKSCKYVDKAVKQKKLLDIRTLRRYKVDCVTIGSDWKNKSLEGLEWMKKNGEVIYLPYTKRVSSTEIKRRIIQSSYDIIKSEVRRKG